MLSKVADRIYWMGRYLERTEDVARLISVYGDLLLDLPRSTGLGWQVVSAVLGSSRPVRGRRKPTDREVLRFLLVGNGNAASLSSSIAAARENARTARDILPTEAWRAVNELHLFAQKHLKRSVAQRYRDDDLAKVVRLVQLITGLLHGTMSHGPAHQFLRIGRHIERADMTSRVVDVAAATLRSNAPELAIFDNTLWMTVLRSVSGYQMYRQFVRRRVRGADVLNFLLNDAEFPRSIRHCIDQLHEACGSLPNPQRPRKVAAQLAREIQKAKLDRMTPAEVHEFVDRLQQGLAGLDASVVDTWFAPAVRRRSRRTRKTPAP